jgi:hypothetical protein
MIRLSDLKTKILNMYPMYSCFHMLLRSGTLQKLSNYKRVTMLLQFFKFLALQGARNNALHPEQAAILFCFNVLIEIFGEIKPSPL